MSDKPHPVPSSIHRLRIGSNVALQIVILAAIVAMVNYLAFNHYKRWDFSREQKYALSDQTRKVLDNLPSKIRFIVFLKPGSPVFVDVQELLKEYQYAANKKIAIETVDPYRNLTRARELQAKYRFGAGDNVVIVDAGERHKFVNETAMAEIDNSGLLNGQPPQVSAFKGEGAITAAILEVTEGKQNILYFTTGHGEPGTREGSPTEKMSRMLEQQNIRIEPLDFSTFDEVPSNAAAVVVAGARNDFSEREIVLLEDYWKRQGRLFVLMDPEMEAPRLHRFLATAGIQVNNDRVLRTVNLGPLVGILREASAVFQPGNPITGSLAGTSMALLGTTRSLKPAPPSTGNPAAPRITRLMVAAEGFWGETTIRHKDTDPVTFIPSEDNGPPVVLAAASEIGAIGDDRVHVGSSRLVVIANATFFLDDGLEMPGVDFFLGAVNWLVNRESLIGISPKEIRTFTLNLTDVQLQRLAVLCMFAVPAGAGVLGFFVWLRRRA